MTQTQLDTSTHLGFQLSLLKLSSIQGQNGNAATDDASREARQLEALVDRVLASSRR